MNISIPTEAKPFKSCDTLLLYRAGFVTSWLLFSSSEDFFIPLVLQYLSSCDAQDVFLYASF